MRLCKVIFLARPRPGSSGAGKPRERGFGDRGRPWGCGRLRSSTRDLLSLLRLANKAVLDQLPPGVPFGTQDFLPDPSRPDWGASGPWNLVESLGSFFFSENLIVTVWSEYQSPFVTSKSLPAFGFFPAPVRSLRTKNESANLSAPQCSWAPGQQAAFPFWRFWGWGEDMYTLQKIVGFSILGQRINNNIFFKNIVEINYCSRCKKTISQEFNKSTRE